MDSIIQSQNFVSFEEHGIQLKTATALAESLSS